MCYSKFFLRSTSIIAGKGSEGVGSFRAFQGLFEGKTRDYLLPPPRCMLGYFFKKILAAVVYDLFEGRVANSGC